MYEDLPVVGKSGGDLLGLGLRLAKDGRTQQRGVEEYPGAFGVIEKMLGAGNEDAAFRIERVDRKLTGGGALMDGDMPAAKRLSADVECTVTGTQEIQVHRVLIGWGRTGNLHRGSIDAVRGGTLE
jgi:hypothetical protein